MQPATNVDARSLLCQSSILLCGQAFDTLQRKRRFASRQILLSQQLVSARFPQLRRSQSAYHIFQMRLTALHKKAGAHDEGIWSAAWVPGSTQLLTGAVDETIKIWDAKPEELSFVHTLSGFSLGVVSLCVDPSGTYAAASSLDSNIRVWNMAGYETKNIIETTPTELWRIAFGPTTPEAMLIAAAGGSRHEVVLYRTSLEDDSTAEARFALPTAENKRERFVLSVAVSPDGKSLAAGAMDGSVVVWDMSATGGPPRATLKGHHKPVRQLTWTPDSRMLITACDDCHAHLYDVAQASLVDAFSGHESWVLDVAMHPSGSHFVSASSDAHVKLWDLGTRTCSQTLTDHTDQVWAVAFSTDGTRLASAADDKQLIISSVA